MAERVRQRADWATALSDRIWELAEVGLQEHQSSALLAEELAKAGFEVTSGVADMPTAFVATYGSGKPVVAILGEYDALPGLSQKAVPRREPLREGAPGHGCGHNLLGVAGVAAAIALKEEMESSGLGGTVRYYGCPAEETLVGKVFMVRDGLFDDVDAALTWHPAALNSVWAASSLANNSAKFRFYGRSAHAAANPDMGRSALDAVEIMNVGANYLREHVVEKARIHYVITRGGGEPNVVPAEAEVWYYVRAPKREQVEEIYQRLLLCAKGAAIMTETEYDVEFLAGCYQYLPNRVLGKLLHQNLRKVGAPPFDEADRQFARQLRETFAPGQQEAAVSRFKELAEELRGKDLHDGVLPLRESDEVMPGSTDVGDVSWVVPTAQFATACTVIGAAGHSWQMTATSGMSIGHKGMLTAAEVLALTVRDLLTRPEVLAEAREEFRRATEGSPYRCPLPQGARPPHHQLEKH